MELTNTNLNKNIKTKKPNATLVNQSAKMNNNNTTNNYYNNNNTLDDLPDENNINLKSILENYVNDSDKFKFDYLISLLKQNQLKENFLNKFLDQLKQCVHLLEPKYFENNLINFLLFDIKWHLFYSSSLSSSSSNYTSIILNKLSEFLIDLNSAYTSYIYKSLTMLVKFFLVVPPSVSVTSSTSTNDQFVDYNDLYKFSHNIIFNLIKIAPSSKTHLIKQVEFLFPYMTKDTALQEAYVKNILKIIDYAKDLRLIIFEICVQKMLKIDVNCTRENIIDAELITHDPVESTSDSISSIHITSNETENQLNESSMKHPLADRLDVMMRKLFLFIQSCCYVNESEKQHDELLNKKFDLVNDSDLAQELKFDWESTKSVYKDLLFIFDKYILLTYGSSHVQFLMFYICSYRSMLSEGFLDYLWKKFSSPNSCAITKQVCAYYIGSFLSRAKYIPLNTCVATLQLMVTWIHNYINKISMSNNFSNFDLHRTFYALCQTLFYIIIFRHRQLFDDGKDNLSNLVKSWKLNEIVSSNLNPLRYCMHTVRKKFARIAYINQIAYCYSIIDANNRISLPMSGESTNKNMFFSKENSLENNSKSLTASKKSNSFNNFNQNPLDSFFPFDPYLLKRSKLFIDKFYQEFQDIVDNDDSNPESDDDESIEDNENTSDEEDEDDVDEEDDDDDDEDNQIDHKLLDKSPRNFDEDSNEISDHIHMDDSDLD